MPPTPKPEQRRQRRNTKKTAATKTKTAARRGLKVVAGGKSTTNAGASASAKSVPRADPAWLASTKKHWGEFWSSPAARKIETSLDLPAVDRLFALYDERARSLSAFRRNRLVKGSQGQAVLNPLGRQINSLNTQILALEDRLGLSPMARLKLNLTLGEDPDEPGSLDDLNDALSFGDDDFD